MTRIASRLCWRVRLSSASVRLDELGLEDRYCYTAMSSTTEVKVNNQFTL